jgi:uncharacterized protein (TIGR02145 family)
MGELFKLLKTYQKGGSPKLMIDWVAVPRKIRIKIVKEVLPAEFIDKLEHLNLIDEIFNGDDVENEITYKKRLERYLERYPDFNEFVFESCHWKNVRYDVNFNMEQDTKELYKNDFQYLYYAIFGEIFSVQSYKTWSEKLENLNKFLSDYVREIKFGKNKYQKKDKIELITDIDGNVYKTIQIGNQIWMAENLRVSRYRNGDTIPFVEARLSYYRNDDTIERVEDKEEWSNLKTGACNYDIYDTYFENGKLYNRYAIVGKFYNWYAVNDKRGLAPKGWHVPSDEEWSILTDFLAGGELAGDKLKETSSTNWKKTNEDATIKCGFLALPGGFYRSNGSDTFYPSGDYGTWWSASESADYAWLRSLGYCDTYRGCSNKSNGISVRCVMDSD